jgi:hypothetical protein
MAALIYRGLPGPGAVSHLKINPKVFSSDVLGNGVLGESSIEAVDTDYVEGKIIGVTIFSDKIRGVFE